jgi:hypothetical protein
MFNERVRLAVDLIALATPKPQPPSPLHVLWYEKESKRRP